VAGVAVLLLGLLAALAWVLARGASAEVRSLTKRIVKLPWRAKLRVGLAIVGDSRIPFWLRGIPPALILYLAMPLDIIPDFIPVLGQIDDVLVVLIAAGLLVRLVPRDALRDAVQSGEREAERRREARLR